MALPRCRFLLFLLCAVPAQNVPVWAASHSHGQNSGAPAGVPTVEIRAGDHKGLSRILLTWHTQVGFVVDEAPDSITVTFDHPAKADLGSTATQKLRDVVSIAVAPDPSKLVLKLGVKAGARSRAFKTGNIVIVDILDPPAGMPETAPAETAPAPVTAAAGPEAKTDSKPQTADETVVHLQPDRPASLVAFQRGQYLWLATDGKVSAGMPSVAGPAATLLSSPARYMAQNGTLFRYLVKPASSPDTPQLHLATRQHGGGWDVILSHQAQASATLVINAAATENQVSVTAPGATQVISFVDPDLGDTLSLVPLPTAGELIVKSRRLADADIFATAQGFAAVTRGDHVAVGAALGEITISGMALSADSGMHGTAPSLFDLQAWYKGGPEKLLQDRQDIEHAVIGAEDTPTQGQAIELARLFLANGYGNEASAALQLAASDNPDVVKSPDYIAMRGATEALQGRIPEARADLTTEALQNQPEASLWRALAAAQGTPDERQEAFSILRSDVKTIDRYPAEIKRRFSLALAALAVENNEPSSMEAALGLLTRGEQADSMPPDAAIAALKAGLASGRGKFDDADKLYASVPACRDQYWTALAGFAAVENGLGQGTLPQKDAITRLEGLRYGWRGDDYEYRVLGRLGELYFAAGDYKSGLETMRVLIDAAAGTPFADEARKKVIDTARLAFSPEVANKSSPLDTFALYNTFLPFLPPHTVSDPNVRALSDRLAAIGVMDEAVGLIEPQMHEASDSAVKGRLGERIAALRLLDDKPDLALRALADSESDRLEPAQKSDRKLLQARALFKSGKPDEAVAALGGETSREADALRVEIAWPRRDWKDAAAALGRLASSPAADGSVGKQQADIVLNEAVALNLGRDPAGLEQLRRSFALAMARSHNASAFALLTSPGSDMRAPSLDAVKASVSGLDIFENFLSSYRREPGKA